MFGLGLMSQLGLGGGGGSRRAGGTVGDEDEDGDGDGIDPLGENYGYEEDDGGTGVGAGEGGGEAGGKPTPAELDSFIRQLASMEEEVRGGGGVTSGGGGGGGSGGVTSTRGVPSGMPPFQLSPLNAVRPGGERDREHLLREAGVQLSSPRESAAPQPSFSARGDPESELESSRGRPESLSNQHEARAGGAGRVLRPAVSPMRLVDPEQVRGASGGRFRSSNGGRGRGRGNEDEEGVVAGEGGDEVGRVLEDLD